MWPSSSARPCAPMPSSGGPTSLLPMSPSLWQLEHAPVKSALPLRGVARLLDFRQQRRDDLGSCAFAAGVSASSSAAACCATCRFGMRAQPRDVGRSEARRRDLAVLHRGEQRERGLGPLQDLIEDRRRVGARQRRDHHGIDVAARRSRRASAIRRPLSASGTTASAASIGAIADSACGAPARASPAGWRRSRRGARRSSSRRRARAAARRRGSSAFARQRAGLVPLRDDRQRRRGRRRIVEQLLQRLVVVGRPGQSLPPSIRATAPDDAGLERAAASGRGAGGRHEQPPGMSGQRRRQDGGDEVGQAPADGRSASASAT